jgi:BirA family transcriptional regulator, biotin operon repressor / biotin---[acetyl-CoA-carboxylase] ligase
VSIDVHILRALRVSAAGTVSGADLAKELGVSRAAISARIRDLRALGYDIVASPHLGYRLTGSPDLLHGDDLLARLGPTRTIGRDIRVFEQTSSTSDVIEKLARDGAAEGVVVFAESQTSGRGRLGRQWFSPSRKGLWFSILLRPPLRPQEVMRIMVASGTALRRAIQRTTNLRAAIKWPNDILIRGRKVAGILTELHAELDRVQYVVLGIGLDVNLGAGDFSPPLRKTATSLRIELGHSLSRPELAVSVLRELDNDYAGVMDGSFSAIADEWVEHCETIGKEVVLNSGNRRISGRAEALGDDGALLLRTEHGRIERVVGGDLSTIGTET